MPCVAVMEETLARAVSGVLGGLCAVTVMHPVDVAQKRIQVQDRKLVVQVCAERGV